MGSRLLSLAPLLVSGCAPAQLEEFERILASHDSATAALGEWCAMHRDADLPPVVAQPVSGPGAREPSDARALLDVGPAETLGYRHVRLSCDGEVLSEAHNWFVPARLPPEMLAVLDTTQTPFGKVVAPLGFTRERLSSVRGPAEGCPAGTVLSHRAVLRLPDGRPISLVVECYQKAAVAGS